MARSFADHLRRFGPQHMNREALLRAAFGSPRAEDDEQEEEYADASAFDPEGHFYAEGGEVEEGEEADGFAKGGKPGSGKRFGHLEHELEGEDVKDPRALAAAIGRKKYGEKRMEKWSEKGRERAERHAEGGEVGREDFRSMMARRMKVRRAMCER